MSGLHFAPNDPGLGILAQEHAQATTPVSARHQREGGSANGPNAPDALRSTRFNGAASWLNAREACFLLRIIREEKPFARTYGLRGAAWNRVVARLHEECPARNGVPRKEASCRAHYNELVDRYNSGLPLSMDEDPDGWHAAINEELELLNNLGARQRGLWKPMTYSTSSKKRRVSNMAEQTSPDQTTQQQQQQQQQQVSSHGMLASEGSVDGEAEYRSNRDASNGIDGQGASTTTAANVEAAIERVNHTPSNISFPHRSQRWASREELADQVLGADNSMHTRTMLELRIRLMEDAQQKVDSIKEKTQSKIDELRAELAASESQRGILQQKFGLIKAVLDDPNGGDDSSTLNFIRLVAQL